MVSKRQILARLRFKEAHSELFPKPDPTPPNDPTKKKKNKKKGMFKREKGESKGIKTPGQVNKRAFGKHPLRVPGMRPGESCFICKAKNHIAKHCPEKAHWEKNKICLLCRRRGHGLKNCPNKNDEPIDKKFCYNCGETGHTLSACPQPLHDGGTQFATCFICNERGHLSKNCAKNTHGIYPKGGCCKICGGVAHLARDCPNRGNNEFDAVSEAGRTYINMKEQPRGQVTKFLSGDDIDDDFMADDAYSSKKVKSSENASSPDSKSLTGKPKRKQGQRVVNFVR